jgi:hypothetical protein
LLCVDCVLYTEAIAGDPWWCSVSTATRDCSAGARAGQGIDLLWMLLTAFTPAILAWYARRNTPMMRFTITMGDERFGGKPVTPKAGAPYVPVPVVSPAAAAANGNANGAAPVEEKSAGPQITIHHGDESNGNNGASPAAPAPSMSSPIA